MCKKNVYPIGLAIVDFKFQPPCCNTWVCTWDWITSNPSSRSGLMEETLNSLMVATLLHSVLISHNVEITSGFVSRELKRKAFRFFSKGKWGSETHPVCVSNIVLNLWTLMDGNCLELFFVITEPIHSNKYPRPSPFCGTCSRSLCGRVMCENSSGWLITILSKLMRFMVR